MPIMIYLADMFVPSSPDHTDKQTNQAGSDKCRHWNKVRPNTRSHLENKFNIIIYKSHSKIYK